MIIEIYTSIGWDWQIEFLYNILPDGGNSKQKKALES